MSLDAHLIHLCTIERDTPGAEDPLGGPGAPVTATVASNAPCRFVERQKRILTDDRTQSLVETIYQLILPATVAVQERDRLANLTLEDGTVLADAFTLMAPIARRARSLHHITVDLERVS